jgi:aquaporin Z
MAPRVPRVGDSLRHHWPEYLIEGWALGMFMVSAGVFATLLESPGSALHLAIADGDLRRLLGGIAMGLTAMALIYSPWGQRSGAHMNPAVTLTFLRLGKIKGWDAFFYVAAQFLGGILGVLAVLAFAGSAFSSAPVAYAVTRPGPQGYWVALAAEFAISFGLMLAVLTVSNSKRWSKWTGFCAGLLVAAYITLESPISGMSMNPARTVASALPGGQWMHVWVYFVAPILGMLGAAQAYLWWQGREGVGCAKLQHPADQRCIHCGHEPGAADGSR